MIEPGIGRIVHFHHEASPPGARPHAAMVIDFASERCVSLACFAPEGTYYHRLGVLLLQDDDAAPQGVGYAEWMPFQKGQAMKTEALEAKLATAAPAPAPPIAPAPVAAAEAPPPAPAPEAAPQAQPIAADVSGADAAPQPQT